MLRVIPITSKKVNSSMKRPAASASMARTAKNRIRMTAEKKREKKERFWQDTLEFFRKIDEEAEKDDKKEDMPQAEADDKEGKKKEGNALAETDKKEP